MGHYQMPIITRAVEDPNSGPTGHLNRGSLTQKHQLTGRSCLIHLQIFKNDNPNQKPLHKSRCFWCICMEEIQIQMCWTQAPQPVLFCFCEIGSEHMSEDFDVGCPI